MWLYCVILGVGEPFPVEVDEALTLGQLKDNIKEKNPKTIRCDASGLNLFLAKEDGKWMKVTADNFTNNILDLDRLQRMANDANKTIALMQLTALGFPTENGFIHILVDNAKSQIDALDIYDH
ncbi:hypothetical protein THRCLA_22005 [Thraustotheca clavata]|uniref:Crinkler effector protein N-terminal domain-containing protein n=1 Tax=Thraustotheca clavata TaxID=74557 RepID=A0A1V9ZEL9_9STRA|nr:hypothetical protein THRCLA_22005 [Thraustotheca clavata]